MEFICRDEHSGPIADNCQHAAGNALNVRYRPVADIHPSLEYSLFTDTSTVHIMRINLDHAHIFASDLNATVQFFKSMFGAAQVWDETVAGVRGVRLQLGHAFIHVYDQPPKHARGGPVHHLGIETDDLHGLVDHMKSLGYVFRNPIREDRSFRYVMAAGPDDLLLELFQSLEPARWNIESVTGQ